MKTTVRDNKKVKFVRAFLLLLFLMSSSLTNVSWGADFTYTYQVLDLSHGLATKAQVTASEGTAPVLPDVIKNKLVTTYHYWVSGDVTVNGSTYTVNGGASELFALPSGDATIYVTYDYDNSTSAVDLSGTTTYYIKDTKPGESESVHFLFYNTQYTSADWRIESTIDVDSKRQWRFIGNDPYKIYLMNVYADGISAGNGYLRSNLAVGQFKDDNATRFGAQSVSYLFNTFFLDTDGHIVAANNVWNLNGTTNRYIYLYKNGKTNYTDTGGRFFITGSNLNLSTLNLTYEVRPVSVNYTLLTLSRKVFISVEGDASQGLSLPSLVQSPLVSGYHYWVSTAFSDSNSDGVYELAGGAEEIDVANYVPTEGETIYVTYDYDANNTIDSGSNTLHVDLEGKVRYTINTGSEASPKYICWSNTAKRTLVTSNDSYYVSRNNGNPTAWNDFYLWTLSYEDGGQPDPYAIVLKSTVPTVNTYVGGENFVLSVFGGTGTVGSNTDLWCIPQDANGDSYVKTWALLTGNKLVCRKPGTTTTLNRFNSDGTTRPNNFDEMGANGEVLLNAATIGYHVVNRSGNIAATTRVARLTTGNLSIPADIKSAHIIDDDQHYRYFTTQADAAAYSLNPSDETAIEHNFISTYAQLAALGSTEVYVGYHYDPANIPEGVPEIGLQPDNSTVAGIQRYHVQINNKYWRASDNTWHSRPNFGDGGNELVAANYQWLFVSGNSTNADPYDIRILTPYWSDGYLHDALDNLENGNTNGAYSTGHGMYLSRATGSNAHGHDEVHSFFFTQSDLGIVVSVAHLPNKAGRQSYLYNHNNSYALLQRSTRGGDSRQKFDITKLYLYRVVNKSGDIAVSAYMPVTSPLTVPTGLRTPLLTASQYRFFTTQAAATAYNANPTDAVATAQGAITEAPASGEIFIGYNYVNNPEVMDLSGERWYNIKGILAPNGTATSYYYYQDTSGDVFRAQTEKSDAKNFMFQFTGEDPYNIVVYNGNEWSSNKQALFRWGQDWAFNIIQQRDKSETDNGSLLHFMMLEHEDGYATLAVHNKWWNNSNFSYLGAKGADAYIGMKYYMHYWGFHNNVLRMMNNDSYYYYYSDRNRNGAYATKLVFEPVKYQTTFHIIDTHGREAIKYTGETPANMPLDFNHIPAAIRSPYLVDEDLTFYKAWTSGNLAAQSGNSSNLITQTLATTGMDVYVFYTTSHLSNKPFRLTGSRQFNVRIDGDYYIYTTGGSVAATDNDADKTKDAYYWHLAGNDPYAITLYNNATENTNLLKYDTSTGLLTMNGTAGNANTYFIAMRNNTGAFYEVMAATGEDAAQNYYNIGREGTTVQLYSKSQYQQGSDQLQMQLSTNQTLVHYYIIDKQHNIVIDAIDENVELQVPSSIASPLVATYRYYAPYTLADPNNASSEKTWNFTVSPSGDEIEISDAKTYTLNPGVDAINSISSAPHKEETINGSQKDVYQVFVEYDVNDLVQFNGRDKGSTGKMYMLKFFNGESFYQEDGHDGINRTGYTTYGVTDATKAVYPYSNGDANLYIYGEEQWQEQSGKASSTRSRWPWYIVSENDDPYHVKIQSRQTQNSDYNYLRTYQPQGYEGHIVTGVITETAASQVGKSSYYNYVGKQQPGESNEDFTARVARQVPTEYMVLGTRGHYKLTTTKPISDGTTIERRTVTSFEQYWKTYDTVKKNVLKNLISGYTVASDLNTDPKTVPAVTIGTDADAYRTALTTFGFHAYKAWANAKYWNGFNGVNPNGENNDYKTKGYEYIEHWYQTVDMGDGTFDFVEISIDPALILIDNHGWEIMRKPIPTSDSDAAKATKLAAIKPYDSPMVKAYHFYKKGYKASGFHKYMVEEPIVVGDAVYSSTSMASLPAYELMRDADGRFTDLYVRYDVKEQYASTYSATRDGNNVVQNPAAFLVHQSTQYAMDNGGTDIVGTDVPGTDIANNTTEHITNAMKWYVQPNAAIDAEMGLTTYPVSYLYAGNVVHSRDLDDHLTDYFTNGEQGFDPYNMQIKNAGTGKYFSTNATNTEADMTGGLRATYATSPADVSLTTNINGKYTYFGDDHSEVSPTNTTFMAVADDNGNIRLMPRFDHHNVMTNFSVISAQTSAAPVNDENGTQTTVFSLPASYLYIVVDNSGHESIRYNGTIGDVSPYIPSHLASPMAKDFKFYKNLTLTDGIYTEIPAGADISAKEITSTFGEAGLVSTVGDNLVYVRYSFNPDGDYYGILTSGDWHTISVNDKPMYVDYDHTDGQGNPTIPIVANPSDPPLPPDPTDYAWQCKFIYNPDTEVPDPYDVSTFNRKAPNTRWDVHYAVLSHGDKLAFMLARDGADGETTQYKFLSSGADGNASTAEFYEEPYFNGKTTFTETITYTNESNETVTETVISKYAGAYNGTVSQISFGDVPEEQIVYYVITNDGKLALTAKEPASRAKGEPTLPTAILPPWARSPLLNKEDFVYYMDATVNGDGTYTVDQKDMTTRLLGLPTNKVYVRYNYNLETTTYTVKDTYFTSEVAPRLLPLDITGNTWYNIVTYSWGDDWLYAKENDNQVRGLDRPAQYQNFDQYPKENGNFLFQSTKPYLWRLTGSDPYAIKIVNSLKGNDRFLAGQNADGTNQVPYMLTEGDNPAIQTFMLLKPTGNDIRLVATGHKEYFLHNTRWGSDWINYHDNVEDETKENPFQGVGLHSYEFFKAPVVRNYTFHAMNCDGTTPVNTWTMMLRRDWLTQIKLEDDISRICAQYEKNRASDNFGERIEVGNGHFYNAATMTDDDRIQDTGTGEYDVYPEIAEDATYHIYFKYKTKPTELEEYTSTLEQIASDVAYHNAHGRLDVDYPGDAKWWFMVLDTDEDITATGEGSSRTFTGRQMFLRREDNGGVGWMNNDYALHKNSEDNYKNYSCHRLAEWYRKGDNESFREGRWLWTFIGTDPYLMKVLNFESAVGVEAEGEGLYNLAKADNCFLVTEEVTQPDGTKNYPVTVPAAEPSENMLWGMAPGYASENTFSLMAPITNTIHQALFWTMSSSEKADSVAGAARAGDRSNAIKLIRYEPVKYEDVNLIIRRSDEVAAYQSATSQNKPGILAGMTTGLSKLYFAATERMFVAGDKIDMTDANTLPLNVRRAFCNYTLYKDIFTTEGGSYEVTAGPYPTTTQATDKGAWKKDGSNFATDLEGNYIYEGKGGDLLFDEDGNPIMAYTSDGTMKGTPVEGGAQSIYASYEVTSDIFLKKAPTKEQVETMANTNDHVYFMDFPNLKAGESEAYNTGHHAYFHPSATFCDQLGDLKRKVDLATGYARTEKKRWNVGSMEFEDDTDLWYNHCQFKTTGNRMESVPENLKWYFVGDPYKVQVYCTAGAWNETALKDKDGNVIMDGAKEKYPANTVAANLCRFDDTETNFQFVVDCVHLRVPDYSIIDEQEEVTRTDEFGRALEKIHNRHYNQPYFNDFYWECVPAATDMEGAFALRFKEDNDLLGYRNVYYYLAHDGLKKRYRTIDNNVTYNINLSYRPNDDSYEDGNYKGYHVANNDTTIIRLVQPVKVHVSAFKEKNNNNTPQSQWTPNPNTGGYAANSRWQRMTTDELSEYYGLGEVINAVPRHLQRKFVKYGTVNYQLTESRAYNSPLATCSEHAANVFVTGTKINPVFKLNVSYKVDDVTKDNIHLFTPAANPSNPTAAELNNMQWLDVMVDDSHWLYYDKTNVDGSTPAVENQTSLVSDYRRAMSTNKSGWNTSSSGWNDGLKGLHWAFIGDPYDFTVVNRRRYEDGSNGTDPMWLTATKTTTQTWESLSEDAAVQATARDSVIWTTSLASSASADNTSTAIAAASDAAHFSLQMWKTGGNNDYFLRTASLKEGENDYNNDATEPNINQTNNYWRLVAKSYPDADTPTSYFEMVPYSLATLSTYNSNPITTYYSKTMSGLGPVQQRLTIHTTVARDDDGADNDCFDADVEVRTTGGELRLAKEKMEIRYGNAVESMPVSLKRYGCEYTCFIDYDPATKTGTQVTNFDTDDFRAQLTSGRIKLTYVYNVQEQTSQFFTTEQDAKTEDYTWLNTYFRWLQYYQGTNVEVEELVKVFDHYVYNSDGHIIDEVYREEIRKRIVTNPTEPYETKGYVNTHTGQTPVYGDESVQSENDRQKWSLIGDPYGFTMKNYAQYLTNSGATVVLDDADNVLTQNVGGQQFALAVDKDGNPYLAIIYTSGDEAGQARRLVDFLYDSKSDKSLYGAGSGVNLNDPTGNTLATTYARNGKSLTVKPFYMANLMRYADILVYHLVMAHQHSLDNEDASSLTSDQWSGVSSHGTPTGVNSRLIEFLKYWEKRENKSAGTYIAADASANGSSHQTVANTETVTNLLKQKGTLRDFLSFPVPDQEVSRIGIGNRPQVPWYMKRQFCSYYLYQKDIMRSVTTSVQATNSLGEKIWQKNENGVTVLYYGDNPPAGYTPAYDVSWVSLFDISYWSNWDNTDDESAKHTVTQEDVAKWGNGLNVGELKKIPSGYAQGLGLQGQILERLEDCHHNRKVIIDVVYEVNPKQFRFADKGRNTTAWYQMMTYNDVDGLMNFTYKDGIGARQDLTHHYTNNYLWAPEGDPYGFVLRSRYATINGTGWDAVAVTTKGHLPKSAEASENVGNADLALPELLKANYTSSTDFNDRRIIHQNKRVNGIATDGPENAVYEMFVGGYDHAFLMHPTSAWMNNDDADHNSYYMTHVTATNSSELTLGNSTALMTNTDANWRLECTPEQLLPYFDRAGYVGGLQPDKAQLFANTSLYNRLKEYKADPTMERNYSVLMQAQQLVYEGTFKDNAGIEVNSSTPRSGIALPMTFESANLVNMKAGYYRIKAFSEDALNTDGEDLVGNNSGVKGIIGPRYISGYRFESEKTDPVDTNNDGGRWLHFFETDKDHATIHTFADLKTKITAVLDAGQTDRDVFDHKAMQGNIEILPADFDPSSIFQFTASAGGYNRYLISTQGMDVHARPGGTEGKDATFGKTELINAGTSPVTGFDNRFRLDDIGGTAVTLRTFSNEPSGDWDTYVAENLKTNYVCIDRNHRYRITCHTNNEMVEIGDHYTTDGYNGIQDTKWLLQPVGAKEDWPYNQMPLRVEVQKGGVNASGTEDSYYYGSLCVPFDTRMSLTTDAAFTAIHNPNVTTIGTDATGTITMTSLSQLNNMGNPQYVPATWPVVLRTSLPGTVTMKNQDNTNFATRHYINMYLPYDAPQGLAKPTDMKLEGEYLEQTLSTSQHIMVFGLPFVDHANGTDNDVNHHEYDPTKRVGFYTNDNWNREGYSDYKAHAANYPSTATVAADDQRSNIYVYHNKAYLPYTLPSGSRETTRAYVVALFDGEEDEDHTIDDDVTGRNVPWPCEVYDLQGRRVAENETPATLRKNHPALSKGVYIFGGLKVVVK